MKKRSIQPSPRVPVSVPTARLVAVAGGSTRTPHPDFVWMPTSIGSGVGGDSDSGGGSGASS